ncbi:MAG: pyrroline-5-carboxylate reductase [Pedosphaera sp.]|nr:pyrroline-5-carboxylate reductase [Pedosphaera sp.]
MPTELSIGFLGAGKMASALAKGFVQSGLVAAGRIVASDVMKAARQSFTQSTRGKAAASNVDVLEAASTLILAVKPDQVDDLLAEIKPHFTSKHLLISIAAGVTLARLESGLGDGARVVRVMPNTPALVGACAAAFATGKAARAEDGQLVLRLFSAVGIAFQTKESLLDAVTGLSGSGPAYACLIIEALSDGGVAAGLPREVATKLAAQTLLGSAKMVLETGLHPGVLKDMVTSPGGTTIEGLHELEKGGLRAALMNAVRAATEKSKKLGQR